MRANRSRRAIRPALASHAQRCRVHRISSRVRDDRDTPLLWDETAAVIKFILVCAGQRKFFFLESTTPATTDLARRAVAFFFDALLHRGAKTAIFNPRNY